MDYLKKIFSFLFCAYMVFVAVDCFAVDIKAKGAFPIPFTLDSRSFNGTKASNTLNFDDIKNASLSKKEPRINIEIVYPVTGNQIIDLELANWANNQMKTFLVESEEFKKNDQANFQYSLDITYKIFHTDNTLSVIFNTSTFTGGAHPVNGQMPFIFYLNDASRLDLLDLFKADEKEVVTLLAKLCYQNLKENLAKLGFEMDDESIPQELETFSVFAVDKFGLTIFFEPYQVAPYSFGFQTVTIPLKSLESLKPRMEFWQ
ncbi:DUF3298 and DUF4163 domain-containing protein [Desulfovibrio litoralis]|uniref:DUF3298 domain-containing protein n=1 Tax=Desulfovibrio litoralis DSM 11393 TaxID=1121455 RepID=A0A1M7RWG4_9BACT|nr:DUF3298 and DUF4163 domain-containing protein [Desulfovibrio litoralis]SHN50464.1 protein of unknown function [Desulfovibrio litoralis DSM 11393]